MNNQEGFIPKHGALPEWTASHRYAKRLRTLNRQANGNEYATFKRGIEHPDLAICTNVIIGLIKVTYYLLDRQKRQLERAFVREGGLRERMTRTRLNARKKQAPRNPHL